MVTTLGGGGGSRDTTSWAVRAPGGTPRSARQQPPPVPQPLPRCPPPRCGHLQHGADPATSQHLQQLCEVGEALRRGQHVPLQPEPGVRRAWPRAPEALQSQARPSPRDRRWLSRILQRLGPAQGRTAGRARSEETQKKLEQRQRGGPSRETLLTPKSPVPRWWGEGSLWAPNTPPLLPPPPPESPQRPGAAARAGRRPRSRHFPSRPAVKRRQSSPAREHCRVFNPRPGFWGWFWLHALGYTRLSGNVGWVRGAVASTWFQGRLTVKPRPRPRPTASASDSRRCGQKCPCS